MGLFLGGFTAVIVLVVLFLILCIRFYAVDVYISAFKMYCVENGYKVPRDEQLNEYVREVRKAK